MFLYLSYYYTIMRWSKAVIKTLRNTPSEATDPSHQLMLRSSMISQVAPGIYNFLPLGLRVLRNVEGIVREEMDRAGGQEILMPTLIPRQLWEETGRWERYGPNLMHVTDRKGTEYGLGPTHEEPVTDIARTFLRSHRDLGLEGVLMYQIQTKVRDELRPRGGVLRGKEFGMKDAYSFDKTAEGSRANFERMREAYNRIFQRIGLNFTAVRADSGAIGGDNSMEFIAFADSGDVEVFGCDRCDYKANVEKAAARSVQSSGKDGSDVETPAMIVIDTPELRTVDDLVSGLPGLGHHIPAANMIKTILYQTSEPGNPVIAAEVLGSDAINEVKLANAVGCAEVSVASHAVVEEITRAPVGYAGPINLPSDVRLYIDPRALEATDVLFGVNVDGKHAIHADPKRDITHPYTAADIRSVQQGDSCANCDDGTLGLQKGIEIGHIFQLGIVYSKPMGATFTDDHGQEEPFVMGCYGIGTTRAVAVAVLQSHDEHGIIWGKEITPYHAVVTITNMDDLNLVSAGELLYQQLSTAGYGVLLDDRGLRAAEKFKDADLVGVPLRVNVGRDFKQSGQLELRDRRTGQVTLLSPAEIEGKIAEFYR